MSAAGAVPAGRPKRAWARLGSRRGSRNKPCCIVPPPPPQPPPRRAAAWRPHPQPTRVKRGDARMHKGLEVVHRRLPRRAAAGAVANVPAAQLPAALRRAGAAAAAAGTRRSGPAAAVLRPDACAPPPRRQQQHPRQPASSTHLDDAADLQAFRQARLGHRALRNGWRRRRRLLHLYVAACPRLRLHLLHRLRARGRHRRPAAAAACAGRYNGAARGLLEQGAAGGALAGRGADRLEAPGRSEAGRGGERGGRCGEQHLKGGERLAADPSLL